MVNVSHNSISARNGSASATSWMVDHCGRTSALCPFFCAWTGGVLMRPGMAELTMWGCSTGKSHGRENQVFLCFLLPLTKLPRVPEYSILSAKRKSQHGLLILSFSRDQVSARCPDTAIGVQCLSLRRRRGNRFLAEKGQVRGTRDHEPRDISWQPQPVEAETTCGK